MPRQGRALEQLVAVLEDSFDSESVEVQSPGYVTDRDTGQTREVDVVVRGSIGSTDIFLIFECRDRSGVQDVRWIEQLATKVRGVGADKVVAVSSSKFSSGAVAKAAAKRVELRRMEELDPASFVEEFGERRYFLAVHRPEKVELVVWTKKDVDALDEPLTVTRALLGPPSDDKAAAAAKRVPLRSLKVAASDEDITVDQLWRSIWRQVNLPENHPHEEHRLAHPSRKDWTTTPPARQQELVFFDEQLLCRGLEETHEIGAIAVSFDWHLDQVEVPVTEYRQYLKKDQAVGKIARAPIESDYVNGAFYMLTTSRCGPKLRVQLSPKDRTPAPPED